VRAVDDYRQTYIDAMAEIDKAGDEGVIAEVVATAHILALMDYTEAKWGERLTWQSVLEEGRREVERRLGR